MASITIRNVPDDVHRRDERLDVRGGSQRSVAIIAPRRVPVDMMVPHMAF